MPTHAYNPGICLHIWSQRPAPVHCGMSVEHMGWEVEVMGAAGAGSRMLTCMGAG